MRIVSSVVLVGSEDDPHIQTTLNKLKLFGVDCIILDVDKRVLFSLVLGGPEHLLSVNGCLVDVQAIWYHLKRPSSYFLTFGPSAPDVVKESEWLGYARGLWELYSDRSVNKAVSVSRANIKILQLQTAVECGFSIPRTLISNHKERLVEFVETNPSVIKGISADHFIPASSQNCSRIIETRPIEIHSIKMAEEAVIMSIPNFLQTKIPKVAEWRISVFGSRHFGVKFEPRTTEQSDQTDWRRIYRTANAMETSVPLQVSEKINGFMRKLDLRSATFDFGETAEGEFVFFECNPARQWAWLDTNGTYAEAMADVIVASSKRR